MTRARLLMLSLGALVVFIAAGRSEPASVGPPWISLEMPANPMDPTTRGAALVVHVFHHQHAAGYRVSGTAEGLVDGERRSIELEFRETSRPGVYALDQKWPAEGHWVLAISTGANADVSLVVELGSNGGVEASRFYEWPVKQVAVRSAVVVQGRADAKTIESALRAMAAAD
jgi:hypothetical protein